VTQEGAHMKLNPHKIAFTKKKTFFTSQLDSDLSKKLAKLYPLRIAFYGAENWTLRKEYQEYLELLKCCVGEGCRKSVGPIA
jgi:hypothetical protein